MNDILTQPTPQTEAEYEAAFAQLLSEMQRIREQMDSDQADIERLKAERYSLKAETRAMLAALKAMLQMC
jgi:hypothetical protein